MDCGGSCGTVCPRCNDGIRNGGEEGWDCGGPCKAQCLELCFDGLLNGAETQAVSDHSNFCVGVVSVPFRLYPFRKDEALTAIVVLPPSRICRRIAVASARPAHRAAMASSTAASSGWTVVSICHSGAAPLSHSWPNANRTGRGQGIFRPQIKAGHPTRAAGIRLARPARTLPTRAAEAARRARIAQTA